MNVAVSALGPSIDDMVDEHFGRARYLLFVSPEGELIEAVENSANRNAMQGAGIGSAELVSSRGAGAVLTGHLGPKAFSALSAAGVAGYAATGMTVRDAVAAFGTGALDALDEAGPAHGG